MAECPYCYAEVAPGMYQCPNCGSPLAYSQSDMQAAMQAAVQPAPQSFQTPLPPQQMMSPPPMMQMQQPMMQPYAPSAMPVSEPVVSVGSWVGYLLLCACLPLLGPIITALSPKEQSVRNFGKAFLALECVMGAIFMAFITLLFILGF